MNLRKFWRQRRNLAETFPERVRLMLGPAPLVDVYKVQFRGACRNQHRPESKPSKAPFCASPTFGKTAACRSGYGLTRYHASCRM